MSDSTTDASFPQRYVTAHRWMLLARILEEKIASLYRAGGKIVGGVYVGRGQEAFSAALGVSLKKGDIFGPLIRDMAGRLAFGEPILDTPRTYFGSVKGPMRGRDGNIHRGRPKEGMPAMISHLGSLISVVNGMLIARRFRGETQCVGGTTIGDGGMSTGAFHEGINVAAVEKLPLVIGVANNQFAYSTPTSRQFACEKLVDRAKGYGVKGYEVDGTSLEDCLHVFEEAVQMARGGDGPQMVVGSFLRLAGHGEHDDASYVPKSMRNETFGRDCLLVSMAHLRERDWATDEEQRKWKEEAVNQVDEAIAKAQKEPGPDASTERWVALSTSHLMEGNSE